MIWLALILILSTAFLLTLGVTISERNEDRRKFKEKIFGNDR